MRKNRLGAGLIALTLLVGTVTATFTGCMRELTEQQSAALVALQSAVTYYETDGSVKDWQGLVALSAANRADGIGVNWNAIELPDSPTAPIVTPITPAAIEGADPQTPPASPQGSENQGDAVAITPAAFTYMDVSPYPGAVISAIIKGEEYSGMASSLLYGQNPANGAFTESNIVQHIWSMITLTAAVGKDQYDYDKAAEYLLTYQRTDGGFGYSVDSTDSDMTLTGIASVALAPYYEKHKKNDQMKALVSYYKEMQTATGGYEGPDGETATSNAMAIWGLTALRQKLPETKDGEKTPVDALLAFQNEDGSFREKLDGEHTASDTATKQATIALCDVLNTVNSFTLLSEDAESYRIENITGPGITLNIDYPTRAAISDISTPFTVEEGTTALGALEFYSKLKDIPVVTEGKDAAQYVQSIDGAEEKTYGTNGAWIYQVNGSAPAQQGAASITLNSGDVVSWIYVLDISQTIME